MKPNSPRAGAPKLLRTKYVGRDRAGRDPTQAKKRLRNLKGRKRRAEVVALEISERQDPGEGARCPAGRGGGTCHSRLGDSPTRRPPAPARPREASPPRPGPGPRGSLSATPEPAPRVGASALPEERPPAPSARRLRPAGPVTSGRVPSAESGARRVARPSRHLHLTGAAGDPATRARPPRTHRASLVAGSALSASLRAAGLPRLSGRPPGALGLGRVRGRGRLAPAGGARRPHERTPALTGPGAPGRADRSGERGCRLR